MVSCSLQNKDNFIKIESFDWPVSENDEVKKLFKHYDTEYSYIFSEAEELLPIVVKMSLPNLKNLIEMNFLSYHGEDVIVSPKNKGQIKVKIGDGHFIECSLKLNQHLVKGKKANQRKATGVLFASILDQFTLTEYDAEEQKTFTNLSRSGITKNGNPFYLEERIALKELSKQIRFATALAIDVPLLKSKKLSKYDLVCLYAGHGHRATFFNVVENFESQL